MPEIPHNPPHVVWTLPQLRSDNDYAPHCAPRSHYPLFNPGDRSVPNEGRSEQKPRPDDEDLVAQLSDITEILPTYKDRDREATSERDLHIVRGYLSGHSPAALGKIANLTPNRVRQILVREGVWSTAKPAATNVAEAELQALAAYDDTTPANRYAPKTERNNLIVAAYRGGARIRDIAAAARISEDRVGELLDNSGVRTRRRPRKTK